MLPGRVSIIAGTILALVIPGAAVAGSLSGQPDTGFGNTGLGSGGTVSTDYSGFFDNVSLSDDRAYDIVTYASGKLVAVGEAEPDGEDADFALAAYEPSSGATDESDFGRGGRQTTDFDGSDDVAQAAAVASDGKLVVAGTADVGTERFAVARYRPNGRLDRSFSGDGRATTKFPGSEEDFGEDVVVSGNGKITVAGVSEPDSGGRSFALARYNPDGSRDKSFGGDGRVVTGFPDSQETSAGQAIAAAGRGRVVVAGWADPVDEDFALARYRRDGTRDPAFNGDGRVTTDIDSESVPNVANDVVITADGSIIAGGLSLGTTLDFAIARYASGGGLQSDEVISFGAGEDEVINALALQPSGKLLAAGRADDKFALFRLLAGGGVDTFFSSDAPAGIVYTDFSSPDNNDSAEGITLAGLGQGAAKAARGDNQPQGDPVLAGFTENGGPGFFDFALARYHGN